MDATIALGSASIILTILWFGLSRRIREREPVSPFSMLVAAIIPPLLVTVVLLGAIPRFGDLRISLEGLRFKNEAFADGPVTIGGGRPRQKTDHLIVTGLPENYLSLSLRGDRLIGEVKAPQATSSGHVAATRFAAIRVSDPDEADNPEELFHNSVPLEHGALIELPGGRTLRFNRSIPGFEGVGFSSMEVRTGKFGLPIMRQLGPELKIYPLRYYGFDRPLEVDLTESNDGDLGAFVYRGGGYLRRSFYVGLVESSVKVWDASDQESIFRARAFELQQGERLNVELFRIDYEFFERNVAGEESWIDGLFSILKSEASGVINASRLQERRSFTIRHQKEHVDLIFDTPYYVRLAKKTLADYRARSRNGLEVAVIPNDAYLPSTDSRQMLVRFPLIGDPLAAELYVRLRFQDDRLLVTTHSSNRSYEFGEAFLAGERAGGLVRVSRMEFPWSTILLLWATALAAFVGGWDLRRKALFLVFLSGVEFLLAVRVLIAYQGAFLDPRAASASWISVSAWIWVPFALQVFSASHHKRRQEFRTVIHLCVCELAMLGILVEIGASTLWFAFFSFVPPVLMVAVWLLNPFSLLDQQARRYFGWEGLPSSEEPGTLVSPWASLRGWLKERFAREASSRLEAMPEGPDGPPDGQVHQVFLAEGAPAVAEESAEKPRLRWIILLLVVVLFMRIFLLAVFGWKERIDVGVVAALSIFYVPATLLIFALLWGRRARSWTWLVFWGAIAGLYGLIPMMTHDWGFLLIFPLAPMLLFAWQHGDGSFARRLAHVAPLAGMLLMILGVPLYNIWFTSSLVNDESFSAAMADPAVAQALLESNVRADGNKLRFWSWAAPDTLMLAGTTEAESLAIVMENLSSYASLGPLGRGYLNVHVSSPLSSTHLNDNLSAVHILGATGWVGGLALLVPLLAWTLLPILERSSPVAEDQIPTRYAFGLLSVWTVSIAAIYMFCANVRLLLFTGKNVYLLAAQSLSDVMETVGLILLILWAFAPWVTEGRTDVQTVE